MISATGIRDENDTLPEYYQSINYRMNGIKVKQQRRMKAN